MDQSSLINLFVTLLKNHEEKIDLLAKAHAANWILAFEHDSEIDACRVVKDERGRYRRGEVIDLGGHGRSWE